jgi:hypothetical protein
MKNILSGVVFNKQATQLLSGRGRSAGKQALASLEWCFLTKSTRRRQLDEARATASNLISVLNEVPLAARQYGVVLEPKGRYHVERVFLEEGFKSVLTPVQRVRNVAGLLLDAINHCEVQASRRPETAKLVGDAMQEHLDSWRKVLYALGSVSNRPGGFMPTEKPRSRFEGATGGGGWKFKVAMASRARRVPKYPTGDHQIEKLIWGPRPNLGSRTFKPPRNTRGRGR